MKKRVSSGSTMKTYLVIFVIIGVAFGEKEGPYPPSGWKPDGPQLTYPPPTPSNEYGPASTPSNEYGPASTPSNEYGPAPTEPPTEPPQEPAPTYIPAEEPAEPPPNGGYARYQNGRFSPRASQIAPGQFGQFFILNPQGQFQRVPLVVQQPMINKDAELINPQAIRGGQTFNRLMEKSETNVKTNGNGGNNQRNDDTGKSQPKQSTAQFRSGRIQQQQESSADPTRFVAFIPNQSQMRQIDGTSMVLDPKSGQYHLIHPDGRLQRVQYMNTLGPDNRIVSNVQYQEVDPIRGPLYTLGSPLVRVF
mgnify:CR=1 FL=1